jgi:hypothetical protein
MSIVILRICTVVDDEILWIFVHAHYVQFVILRICTVVIDEKLWIKDQTSKHIFFICERIYYENKPGAKTPK